MRICDGLESNYVWLIWQCKCNLAGKFIKHFLHVFFIYFFIFIFFGVFSSSFFIYFFLNFLGRGCFCCQSGLVLSQFMFSAKLTITLLSSSLSLDPVVCWSHPLSFFFFISIQGSRKPARSLECSPELLGKSTR